MRIIISLKKKFGATRKLTLLGMSPRRGRLSNDQVISIVRVPRRWVNDDNTKSKRASRAREPTRVDRFCQPAGLTGRQSDAFISLILPFIREPGRPKERASILTTHRTKREPPCESPLS